MKKYITTAIDYVNSLPHIGTAYEKIGADVLVRFYRLQGHDVIFQMGNDEHSVNVQKAAQEKGLSPKKYCDEMRPQFESVWKKLNISYDQFIQTSEPRHHAAVQKLFKTIYENGDIYPRDYEGWYCESCEAFYTEKDLVDGLCANHKTKPKWLKEKNYFFKLTKYAEPLLKHIMEHPEFILPEKRRNEVVQFIKKGLDDVSVSRSSFDWGIPLPIDKNHVVYVWFDALINYITGVGFGSDDKKFQQDWTNVTHVIGKDITRFHCIIWPSMLMSAGIPLPQEVLGHGFVYLKGEKMSKTLGNVVTPLDVLDQYPDFGADALRYYLLRGSSFGDDGDFTWDAFIERYNADLANGLGNLVSRILGMVWRYQQGKLQPANCVDPILDETARAWVGVSDLLDATKSGDVCFHLALEKIWGYISSVDQYIDTKAPWALAKEGNKAVLSDVLTTLVEAVRRICFMAQLFVPSAVQKISTAYGFESLDMNSTEILKKEHVLKAEKLNLFPRIEKQNAPAQGSPIPSSKPSDNKSAAPENKEGLIDISDFAKIDLRIAKIISAEKVQGADKLLQLQVEIGTEQRQVIAGVAEYYAPEALVGKSIVVVANLKPAKIRGIESRGMLLAAKDGKNLLIVSPAGDIVSGAKVG